MTDIMRYLLTAVLLLWTAVLQAAVLRDATVIDLTGTHPAVVAIGDVNHDGRPDIVTAEFLCQRNCHVIVLLQAADGTFGTPVYYPSNGGASSIVIGDFNSDGRNDVAIAYGSDCGLAVHYQQADGTLGTATDISPKTWCPYDLAAADLNGDGKTDLVAMPWGSNTHDLYLYIQDANNVLQRHDTTITGGGYDNIGVADLNGDGVPDIFVVSPQSQPEVALRLGTGQGDLGPEQLISVPWFSPAGVAAGDFNHDGKLDFVAGGGGLLLQGPLGTFTPVTMPGLAHYVIAADLNNDGLDDIVAGGIASGNRQGFDVYLQQSRGGFARERHLFPPVFSNFAYPKCITTGDLNRDGRVDVVVALDGGAIVIYYGEIGHPRAARH